MPALTPGELGRVAVLSPHLDDAALSCGRLLACTPGARVITVFAGIPAESGMLTEWDAACGFENAGQAIMQRRMEDREALAKLGAMPVWLDFCDDQYRQPARAPHIAETVAARLREHAADSVLLPAGLFHADHRLAHEAAMLVRRMHSGVRWLMYEDVPYRRTRGLLQQRLATLLNEGLCATPLVLTDCSKAGEAIDTTSRTKRDALACYASQLRGLQTPGRPGVADAAMPEGYWLIEPSEGTA